MLHAVPCDAWFNAPPRATATILITRAAVCFDGPIDIHDGQKLDTALRGRARHTVLVVRSRGGSASEGLEMAAAVHHNASTVMVRDFCVSSCANYIFVPARRRFVLEGGMVGFHGGFSARGVSNGLNDIEAQQKLSNAERDSEKRDWVTLMTDSLVLQNSLLQSLRRPSWYFAMFEYGDPHYLRRPTTCDAGGAAAAMIIVSPQTLRSVGLATEYRGVTTLEDASARLQALKVTHGPLCFME